MKPNFLKLFKHSPDSNSVRLNRKPTTFLVCLLLSIFFWCVTTFSKDYNSIVTMPVKYTNLPKSKVVVNNLPENVEIEITATGFTILYYKLLNRAIPLKVDLKDAQAAKGESNYFIVVNSKLDKKSKQFSDKIRIQKVIPDTIFIDYSKKVSKTIPVKLNANITYDKDYQLKGQVKLSPPTITISGPEEMVKKIKFAETELLQLEDVDSEVKKDVKLLLAEDTTLLKLSKAIIKLTVPVVKFTETSLEIPVQVDNLPKGYSLKIFPDKVSARFIISFDELDKVDASMFRAKVDYSKKTNSKKLRVEVVKKPSNIKSLKIVPEKVEFIVRK